MIHSLKNILEATSKINLRNSTREIASNLFKSSCVGEKYYSLFSRCLANQ
jgi:hypothetical protein